MKETKKQSKKLLASRNCLTCSKQFQPKRTDSVYCSRICYRRNPAVAKKYSDKTNAYQKAHNIEPERRFKKLKYKCNHEEIELTINLFQYIELINKNCVYCNKSLKLETGCSLDRLDSNIGYHINNVVPCCGACNQIKNVHLTYDEMKLAMKAVLEYRNAK